MCVEMDFWISCEDQNLYSSKKTCCKFAMQLHGEEPICAKANLSKINRTDRNYVILDLGYKYRLSNYPTKDGAMTIVL